VKKINASKFKEQCLSILDTLSPEGLIITKHGKPVARLIPFLHKSENLIGCLRNKLKIQGDIYSTGISWNADS
jgi:antitoxin (DNA-binding transcriptional repressor) of toxin-antitoxin stability system